MLPLMQTVIELIPHAVCRLLRAPAQTAHQALVRNQFPLPTSNLHVWINMGDRLERQRQGYQHFRTDGGLSIVYIPYGLQWSCAIGKPGRRERD